MSVGGRHSSREEASIRTRCFPSSNVKSITSKYMTSPLRTLLDSTPHLRYSGGVGEDIFWKAAIESLRKPVGNPPVSIF